VTLFFNAIHHLFCHFCARCWRIF